MEKLKFICLTWNNYLTHQSILEDTCGYYAFVNLIEISNVLRSNNDSNVINKMLKYLNESNNDNITKQKVSYFKKIIKRNMITLNDIKYLENLNKNYNDINKVYINNNKCTFIDDFNISKFNDDFADNSIAFYNFIIQYKYAGIIDHMVPIIINRVNDNVYIHILDSYKLLWNGDNILSTFYATLFGNNIIDNLYCKNIMSKEIIFSLWNKSKEFLEIVIALVIILYVINN